MIPTDEQVERGARALMDAFIKHWFLGSYKGPVYLDCINGELSWMNEARACLTAALGDPESPSCEVPLEMWNGDRKISIIVQLSVEAGRAEAIKECAKLAETISAPNSSYTAGANALRKQLGIKIAASIRALAPADGTKP